jgi:hypothetical protein
MKEYYFQYARERFERPIGFWEVEGPCARRIDIVDASGMYNFEASSGEQVIDLITGAFPSSNICKLELGPGEFYPRMARPDHRGGSPGRNPDRSDAVLREQAISTGQFRTLIDQLVRICRVVHPSKENMQTFGHEIRNIFILACTEVEAQWKNVFKANGCDGRSTRDYVRLSAAMKLSGYSVSLTAFPWNEEITPFCGWTPSDTPTKSLQWYDAYNKTNTIA